MEKYAGQVNYTKKRVNNWWAEKGLGLPAHQMLLLDSHEIQLGMPFLRRTEKGTWEGSIMKATLSKEVDRRDFELGKTLDGSWQNRPEFYLEGEEFYTGVSLAKSSKSMLSLGISI